MRSEDFLGWKLSYGLFFAKICKRRTMFYERCMIVTFSVKRYKGTRDFKKNGFLSKKILFCTPRAFCLLRIATRTCLKRNSTSYLTKFLSQVSFINLFDRRKIMEEKLPSNTKNNLPMELYFFCKKISQC